jgi:tetratricopeptide (TPR) repeat protein
VSKVDLLPLFSVSYFCFLEYFKLTIEVQQARDVEKALDAFTRAVQLDPDNGEAWNNIACLYVVLAFF